MKEYIEKAAVKDEILSWAVCINHPELLSKEDTMHCIDNMPSANVAEVRHGRWIKHEGYDECELCHAKTIYGGNYCPECGTRMDKEDEHEAD